MDCSDWAVNLCDTAAFSGANDSLQKTDQSWSTCHVSQSHAAAPPATYSSPLWGGCWSEDDVAVGSGGEIWWWWWWRWRWGLQFKTLMLIDHRQKHGRLEMWEQTHTHRNARETDRSLKVWRRAISCHSLKACRLLIFYFFIFFLRGCTHAESTHRGTRTLYSSHHLRREKFSHGALCNRGCEKVPIAAKKITKQSNECLLVSLQWPWKHLLDLPLWSLAKYQIGSESEWEGKKIKAVIWE